jgi:hypothetical protein
VKLNYRFIRHYDLGWTIMIDNTKTITLPQQIVALTDDQITFREAVRVAMRTLDSEPILRRAATA